MFCNLLLIFLISAISSDPIVQNADDSSEPAITMEIQYNYDDNWMEIPLDHFNLFDNTTWKMRYFVNDEFFVENNPIFIEVGGEFTIDGSWIHDGPVHKLAKQHNGLLVQTEHRYYGKSLPLGTQFTPENLVYLKIEQALEDLALFIDKFKNSDSKYKNSKVVLHGCSYPGQLVTWMRLKFPHLVDMAYASGAPLGVGLNYREYWKIVNNVYGDESIRCVDVIRRGFRRTVDLMKTHEGRNTVRELLKDWDCGDVYKMNSFEMLQLMILVLHLENDPFKYEQETCQILEQGDNSTDCIHRLVRLVKIKSGDGVCTPSDDTEGETEDGRNDIAWSYQKCTEQGTFRTFQTFNRKNSLHPFALDITVEESVDNCVKQFGGMVTEQVLRTGIERVTRRYGGKKPPVTKVVTVQGNLDPWRDLAVLEDYNPEAPVLLAQGAHCVDLYESEDDPEDILAVRAKVREYIAKWLEELK